MEVIMLSVQWNNRLLVVLSGIVLILGICAASLSLTGCWWDDDDDECLASGENCSSEYLEENYGTTDIYCCSGNACVTRRYDDYSYLVCP
jgi:hypothetical protein